jgi:hypothetical protein
MSTDGCKVDIVTDRYDLDAFETLYDSVDERLLARWTGADGTEPDGYRTLADWFNRRLLKITYDEHGRRAIGPRVSSDYEALTGEDDLLREEVADDLRADGIAVDRLLADTVSWSTMRTHLNACLGGEKTVDRADSGPGWERQSVDIARDVAESKVSEALSSLDSRGELPEADRAGITVQTLLSCPDCPTRIPLGDAIDRGFVCRDHFPVAPTAERGDRQ